MSLKQKKQEAKSSEGVRKLQKFKGELSIGGEWKLPDSH